MQNSLRYLLVFFLCTLQLGAQDLSEKANAFLDLLSDELSSKAQFTLGDEERFNMNYIPIDRKGPTFHDFDEVQKNAALELLRASISQVAYDKVMEIRELEKVLRIIENNDAKMSDGRPRRDPLNYHFCIFGKPSPNEAWGWRFEGHHISLNFTSMDGNLTSATPFFFGTNPGIVKIEEQRGKQVLRAEAELGLELINSMAPDQLKIAKFSESAPEDIITTNQRKVGGIEKKGITYADLKEDQKKLFMRLLDVYIGNYIFEFSETFREKIKNAGLENLNFAWAGGVQEGTGTYYRIHGPMLLIEFDNTQNDANHVHVVIRDLTNDYAEDLLQQHYAEKH